MGSKLFKKLAPPGMAKQMTPNSSLLKAGPIGGLMGGMAQNPMMMQQDTPMAGKSSKPGSNSSSGKSGKPGGSGTPVQKFQQPQAPQPRQWQMTGPNDAPYDPNP